MRMIASAGTMLLPFLAPDDDVLCVTVDVLSSMGKSVLLFLWLWIN
jgi:hypothetical protein